ncbi:MAG: DUF4880 domain-containing protein, partial [Alphaproteobacteria bacterium]|nr:DUF4880 domain-containing protein [Alphaproteobacteria bacterium]
MNNRRQPSRASEWLVALLDQPDDRDLRAAFGRWIAADSAHARDWDEIARTYEVLGEVTPLHRVHWSGHAGEPRALPIAEKRRRPGRRIGLGFAGTALAACLALVLLPDLMLHWTADHVTGTAEQQYVRLEDGSTIRLAPDSAVDIAYTQAERRVTL